MVHSIFSRPELSPTFIRDHNQETQAVWEAFKAGKPVRPPVGLGTNTQYFIFNHDLNPGELIIFEDYMTQANVMLDFSLKASVWRAYHIAPYCDDQIGLPDEFSIRIDVQNIDEAAYFGAPVHFIPHQVPDTLPILAGDKKFALFDQGYPDPFKAGWYATSSRVYQEMLEHLAKHPTYMDRPVKIEPYAYWSNGIFTLAVALRGQDLLTDLYEDPQYVHDLLKYLTEATIHRVKAYHQFFDLPFPGTDLFYADDAIQLISTKMLRQFLIPLLKQYKETVITNEYIKIHLCGDASRHFKILKDELGVNEFEVGFPIDFGRIRQQLGPEVTIHGGPSVMILKEGTPEEVSLETKRILTSGVLEGGRFVLREGNNLAPHTPYQNLNAMYQQARLISY
jgi:hypothetical protein